MSSHAIKWSMAKQAAQIRHKIFLREWLMVIPDKTRAGCAKAASVDISYINNMIGGRRGNPSYWIVLAIADYLGITADDLRQPPPSNLQGLSAAAFRILSRR